MLHFLLCYVSIQRNSMVPVNTPALLTEGGVATPAVTEVLPNFSSVPGGAIVQPPPETNGQAAGVTTLRDYQIEAVEKLTDLPGSCLFMEMGCGKTATALTMAQRRYERGDITALLVIAKNGVHTQWANEEIPKWLTCEYEVQCIYGDGGAKKTHPFNDKPGLKILCVNIDTFSTSDKWKEIPVWHNMNCTMLVLDEATSVKSWRGAKRAMNVIYGFNDVTYSPNGKYITSSKSKSVCRVILTGTPVTNSPMDLWALIEFVHPNYFKRNYYSFRTRYCLLERVPDGAGQMMPLTEKTWNLVKQYGSYGYAFQRFGINESTYALIMEQERYSGGFVHLDELRQLLEPIAYFKDFKDVTSISDPIYNLKRVSMSPEQRRLYLSMKRNLQAKQNDTEVVASNVLSQLVRLQQICSGFLPKQGEQEDAEDYLIQQVEWIDGAQRKLDMLVQDLETVTKPCIVVTKFSCEAQRIYEVLSRDYKVMLFTGWKKTGTLDEFKEGKYEIIVANITSISHGYNLQNSCQMLFYSNTFSLENRLQCEGRIYRLGQTKVCVYTDYVVEDSVEEVIQQALVNKKHLLDYIKGNEV